MGLLAGLVAGLVAGLAGSATERPITPILNKGKSLLRQWREVVVHGSLLGAKMLQWEAYSETFFLVQCVSNAVGSETYIALHRRKRDKIVLKD